MPFGSPLDSGLSSGPLQGAEQLEQVQRNVESVRHQISAIRELLHIRGSFRRIGGWLGWQLEQPLGFCLHYTRNPLQSISSFWQDLEHMGRQSGRDSMGKVY